MSRTIDALSKIEELEQFKKERESHICFVDDDFEFDNAIRYAKCICCGKITEQRVDERTRFYGVGDPCNRSFTQITSDIVTGWWCNECDDEVQIIEVSHN